MPNTFSLRHNPARWSAGLAAAEECDVFLSVGTSGIVYPAAELPLRALGNGATVSHINPIQFEISSQVHFLEGPASDMMQSLLRETFGYHPAIVVRWRLRHMGLPLYQGTAVVNPTRMRAVLALRASILKPLARSGRRALLALLT